MQVQKPRPPFESLVHERRDHIQFFPDDVDPLPGGALLSLETFDLPLDLKPPFANDRKLRLMNLPARLKNELLRRHRGGGHPISLAVLFQRARDCDALKVLLLGLKPRGTSNRIPQLALKALHLRTGPGVIQRDQRLSASHDIAVSNQDLPDDPALQVLNRLAARF
ncbi:hypothetical protein ACVII1_006112 [Bradyrhizobium elkanii]